MRKIIIDYTPPVMDFLFYLRKRKDNIIYGKNTLGGAISFTS